MTETSVLTTIRMPAAANAAAPNATAAQQLLWHIGRDLDRGVFPKVWNGGLVLPSGHPLPLQSLGGEHFHARQTATFQTGPEPATWAGARAPEGAQTGASSAPGNGPSCAAASFPCPDGSAELSHQLQELAQAYPGTRVWSQDRGFWLSVPAAILPGLGRSACFVLQIQPNSLEKVRAWGLWRAGRVGATWIGPRHTNYLDGSICAFEKDAGTWTFGDSLVALLDLLSVWAIRQLYMEGFGRWPGPQASSYPYERLVEFQDTEHCGCAKPKGRYSRCCKPRDLSYKPLAIACAHITLSGWRIRQAPPAIVDLVLHGMPPVGMTMPGPVRDSQGETL